MKILTGQIKRLGEFSHEEAGKTYSVIEIGDQHLTNVFVGTGMDNYLRSCEGRECTLYLNQGRFLFGLSNGGRAYAVKSGAGATLVRLLLTGVFGLLFIGGALGNVIDYRYYRGDSTNIVGALLFGLFAFFTVRAFLRSVSVLKDLGKVRALPGVVLI